jgi:hypothetical protein
MIFRKRAGLIGVIFGPDIKVLAPVSFQQIGYLMQIKKKRE